MDRALATETPGWEQHPNELLALFIARKQRERDLAAAAEQQAAKTPVTGESATHPSNEPTQDVPHRQDDSSQALLTLQPKFKASKRPEGFMRFMGPKAGRRGITEQLDAEHITTEEATGLLNETIQEVRSRKDGSSKALLTPKKSMNYTCMIGFRGRPVVIAVQQAAGNLSTEQATVLLDELAQEISARKDAFRNAPVTPQSKPSKQRDKYNRTRRPKSRRATVVKQQATEQSVPEQTATNRTDEMTQAASPREDGGNRALLTSQLNSAEMRKQREHAEQFDPHARQVTMERKEDVAAELVKQHTADAEWERVERDLHAVIPNDVEHSLPNKRKAWEAWHLVRKNRNVARWEDLRPKTNWSLGGRGRLMVKTECVLVRKGASSPIEKATVPPPEKVSLLPSPPPERASSPSPAPAKPSPPPPRRPAGPCDCDLDYCDGFCAVGEEPQEVSALPPPQLAPWWAASPWLIDLLNQPDPQAYVNSIALNTADKLWHWKMATHMLVEVRQGYWSPRKDSGSEGRI